MSKIQAKHEEKNIKQKQRQRENRIKEMKKNEETEFDFDTETVINMTNKNNKNFMKKNNAAISKNQRKIPALRGFFDCILIYSIESGLHNLEKFIFLFFYFIVDFNQFFSEL